MSKIKICLDAGHYGKYNRSPAVKSYYESDMTWKITQLQKKYLDQLGFEVILTRTNKDKDLALYNRGTASKGCALFISNHSNAVGSGVNESVDYPVAIVPLSGKGDAIGKKLVDCIAATMGTKQPGKTYSRASGTKEWYGVLRGAAAVGTVGLILEHSFHTNTRSTKWLLDDANLDKLAQAEAKVIADYFGDSEPHTTESATIKKGDIVSIAKSATYYNGKDVPDWVIAKQWIVSDTPAGDRVVINKSVDGENAISSPINAKFLTVVTTELPWTPKIGDIVNYNGDKHYVSANATNGYTCKGGLAKLTNIYQLGKSKHPYHLVRVSGKGATVCGWCDEGSFTKA